MKYQYFVDIAGLVVQVSVAHDVVAEGIRARFGRFLTPAATPHVIINCTVREGVQYVPRTPGETWITDVTVEGDCLSYVSYIERGTLNLQTREAWLEMSPEASIENFLRVIFAWLCIQDGSLLLHGAGVIKDGSGYVFFGPSGAGKTTTSLLSAEAGATILSDDIVILRRVGQAYHLCGVPFLGELTYAPDPNQQVPLKGIYRLQQAMTHHIEPLPQVLSIAELVASAPFVVQHSTLGQQLITTCQQIAQTVPLQKLRFKRDPLFWNLIDAKPLS